jgi:hypothetical protein
MMFSFRFGIRSVLLGLLAAATSVAGFAIYNRYFDGSGGTFCETRLAEIDLPKKQICIRTGVDLDVYDPRRIGRPNMVLIKHRDGTLYDCFWFDSRTFGYSVDGIDPSFVEECSKNPRHFEMHRKAIR